MRPILSFIALMLAGRAALAAPAGLGIPLEVRRAAGADDCPDAVTIARAVNRGLGRAALSPVAATGESAPIDQLAPPATKDGTALEWQAAWAIEICGEPHVGVLRGVGSGYDAANRTASRVWLAGAVAQRAAGQPVLRHGTTHHHPDSACPGGTVVRRRPRVLADQRASRHPVVVRLGIRASADATRGSAPREPWVMAA